MNISQIAALCFALAILHTFLVGVIKKVANRYPARSFFKKILHGLAEVELVFAIWSMPLLIAMVASEGISATANYLQSRHFTEPIFVLIVMVVCSSRPLMSLASFILKRTAKLLPFREGTAFFLVSLTLGPMLGGLITEPAAMTVTALILLKNFYTQNISDRLKYATLGLLFVNVSIGGTLTPYAAPPVLMVANQWQWDLKFMLVNFGWKAALAIFSSTAVVAFVSRKELSAISMNTDKAEKNIPAWKNLFHLLALLLVVFYANSVPALVLFFSLFLGMTYVTKEFAELKIKEGLLVACFLTGLVILGGLQGWWLAPIITQLDALNLYLGAILLTAFTDNAALTYLGSQVPNLSEISRYALVAGSVVGGGLTVIANAPNPAGFGILNTSFGRNGIHPARLFMGACVPTLIAGIFFWLL